MTTLVGAPSLPDVHARRSAADHARISDLLIEALRRSPAFGNVRAHEPDGLLFYPLDNTLGVDGDPALRALTQRVDALAREQPLVKALVPLTWVAVHDEIAAWPAPTLSLEEVRAVASSYGLVDEAVVMHLHAKTHKHAGGGFTF